MKRGILGALALLLVAAVLAVPFAFGFWADQRIDRLAQELAANGVLQVTVSGHQRGWLQSSSDMLIEVRGDIARRYEEFQRRAGSEPEPLRCTVRNHIHHGPFPFTHDSKPALAIVDSEIVAGTSCQALQQRLNLTIRTSFGFDGGGRTHLRVPQQAASVGNGQGLVNWHGLDADVDFDGDFTHVRTDIASPGIDVSDEAGDISVRELRWRSDVHEGLEGLDLGTLDATVAAVEFSPKRGDVVHTTLHDMRLQGFTKEGDNATLDSGLTLSAAQLSAGDLQLGPARYVLSLRNLDAAAVAKIKRAVTEARQKNLSEQQTGMIVGATLLGQLPDILKKRPVLEFSDLSIVSPQGTAKGSARLSIDTSDPAVIQNPLLLSQAVVLDAHMQVPEALLVALAKRSIAKEVSKLGTGYSDEQLESMARMRVRQGMASERAQQWFVLDGDNYVFELRMAQGQVTLNGHPVQPGQLGR